MKWNIAKNWATHRRGLSRPNKAITCLPAPGAASSSATAPDATRRTTFRGALADLFGALCSRRLRDRRITDREMSPSSTADVSSTEVQTFSQGLPAKRPVSSSVASYLQADVPVFVPCFNNPTYTAGMVSQLRTLGFNRIVLVDGGSTYPPMRKLLADPGKAVS
jgi:hypothetical protein